MMFIKANWVWTRNPSISLAVIYSLKNHEFWEGNMQKGKDSTGKKSLRGWTFIPSDWKNGLSERWNCGSSLALGRGASLYHVFLWVESVRSFQKCPVYIQYSSKLSHSLTGTFCSVESDSLLPLGRPRYFFHTVVHKTGRYVYRVCRYHGNTQFSEMIHRFYAAHKKKLLTPAKQCVRIITGLRRAQC
jgi:hypothetical protein